MKKEISIGFLVSIALFSCNHTEDVQKKRAISMNMDPKNYPADQEWSGSSGTVTNHGGMNQGHSLYPWLFISRGLYLNSAYNRNFRTMLDNKFAPSSLSQMKGLPQSSTTMRGIFGRSSTRFSVRS